jgi:hypothetical protein
MISKSKRNGVVLISGDVHFAEIMRSPIPHFGAKYHIYEITSSGLTRI